MNDEHKQGFATYMAMLGTAFDKGALSTEKIDLYYSYLRDLNLRAIGQGVERLIRTRKYPSFPTVAEIREAALGGDVEAEDDALIAWGEANKLCPKLAFFKADSGNPVLDEAVTTAFGSWERMGNLGMETEVADRAHFIKCYKAVLRRRKDDARALAGSSMKQIGTGGEA
jgi:hypothetical protein